MYKHFKDARHSWLRVSKTEVEELGFTPTEFSYQDANFFYLEEDYDMQQFFQAKGLNTREEVKSFFSEISSQYDHISPIRDLI